MTGEDHFHITEGAAQEESLVIHHTLMFQSQKKHYQYKPNIFCLRDRTQTIQLQLAGSQNISLFQGERNGLKYQMLSEELLISYQNASAYPYQLKLYVLKYSEHRNIKTQGITTVIFLLYWAH